MSTSESDKELVEARANIFSLLLLRLRDLHFSRQPPTRYYIGQEYVEDPKVVNCIMTAIFLFPGQVEPFSFWLNNTEVQCRQYGNHLVLTAKRKVSSQLWDDLRLKFVGHEFVIGYLTRLMPRINKYLLENRYGRGHLLSRTFALFEAVEVNVAVAGKFLPMPWPPSLPAFPGTLQFQGIRTPIYVRDFIDAINSYFRYEYEDGIRRVITSAESFLIEKGWKGKPSRPTNCREWIRSLVSKKNVNSSFRRRLRDNLDLSKVSDETINHNLQFIYTLRNRIVHDGYRVRDEHGVLCDKAIGTLYYLIADHCGDQNFANYMFSLHQQFALQKSFFGHFYDLDRIAKWGLDEERSASIVENDEDMDRFMFGSLRITDREKHMA